MWKKDLREKYERITYRKRYKCGSCDEYSLHIEHDSFAECETGYHDIISEQRIFKIVKQDDFDGFYTLDELKESFFQVDDKANEIMMILRKMNKQDTIYSKKQVENINIFFEKSWNIDELLDDYSIKYFREFPERENRDNVSELNNQEYVLSLIEDAHFFANKSANELVLFEYGIKNDKDRITYSGRFFINNSIFHVVASWERIINILAILYNIPYDKRKMKNNSFTKLHEKLRKNEKFKETNICKIIDKLKSDGIFGKVDNARKSNDHDISEHLALIDKIDKEKLKDSNYIFDLELIPI